MARRRPAGRSSASANTSTGRSAWWTRCGACMANSRPASTRNTPNVPEPRKRPMTPIVRQLILTNVAVFLIQNFTDIELLRHFALWPWGNHYVAGGGFVGFEPWQLVTYAFLHG